MNTSLIDIKIAHSSDLHVDNAYTAGLNNGDGAAGLLKVLKAAEDMAVDVVLLAGDIFEHNRLPLGLLSKVTEILSEANREIVILPGNHDPLTEDSVYRRGDITAPDNVSVLGLTHENSVVFEEMDLEIWGNAHFDYNNMTPLRNPAQRKRGWHIAMAHGHYDAKNDGKEKYRPSWLINDPELSATKADYVALGHWDVASSVGPADISAHYSGSPEHANSINIVEFMCAGEVGVRRCRLD